VWRLTSTHLSVRASFQSETVEIFISNDIQMDPNKCENAFFGLCVFAVHYLHNRLVLNIQQQSGTHCISFIFNCIVIVQKTNTGQIKCSLTRTANSILFTYDASKNMQAGDDLLNRFVLTTMDLTMGLQQRVLPVV